MPGPYPYPGVYIEEIPSGVRPIVGVATSNTAFIDYFNRGPVNTPIRCNSWGDFERNFGGLDKNSEASYAIQQYYANRGVVAYVVRVTAKNAMSAKLTLLGNPGYMGSGVSGGGLSGVSGISGGGMAGGPSMVIIAANPGAWGNDLQVGIDYNAESDPNTADPSPGFNIVVRKVKRLPKGKVQVLATETFRNLSIDKTSTRFVGEVLQTESNMIRAEVGESMGGLPRATHEDVILDPNPKPPDAPSKPAGKFLFLGEAPDDSGADGDSPSSPNWASGDGTNPLIGSVEKKTGMYALERLVPNDIFNLLCLPSTANLFNADNALKVYESAVSYCESKRAFLIVDILSSIDRRPDDQAKLNAMKEFLASMESKGLRHRNAAVFFPRVVVTDPLNSNRPRTISPSGTMAGVFARTDTQRGVWKAPAGIEASLRGVTPDLNLNDAENGILNPIGANVLRTLPGIGSVSWGARTLEGSDRLASEWKYIPVRRTALFIEETLYQNLTWVVFEPNDLQLWGQIRMNVISFMHGLFRQGAFQGRSPRDAYFVKCDEETTTQTDIDLGIVNIVVGFAPLKPAEFVIVKLQQMAGNRPES